MLACWGSIVLTSKAELAVRGTVILSETVAVGSKSETALDCPTSEGVGDWVIAGGAIDEGLELAC